MPRLAVRRAYLGARNGGEGAQENSSQSNDELVRVVWEILSLIRPFIVVRTRDWRLLRSFRLVFMLRPNLKTPGL
jgi:hypothetical protein